MKRTAIALGWGATVGAGIGVAGLARPEVILGFVDVTGAWDPTLGIALLVAIALYGAGFARLRRRGRPLLPGALDLPTESKIDGRLVAGSALFGVGWGLAGMCPGAVLVGVGSLDARALGFTATMLLTIYASVALRRQRLRVRNDGSAGLASTAAR